MDMDKRERLEAVGYAVGNASDFLELTAVEAELVELKTILALFAKEQRKLNNLSQDVLAKKMGLLNRVWLKLNLAILLYHWI